MTWVVSRRWRYWNVEIFWQLWWSLRCRDYNINYCQVELSQKRWNIPLSICFVLFLSPLFLQWKQMKLLAIKAVQFILYSSIFPSLVRGVSLLGGHYPATNYSNTRPVCPAPANMQRERCVAPPHDSHTLCLGYYNQAQPL